ncbi:MAG: tryptophan halogenase family protein [Blastocatellia bacterium]
MPQNIQTIVIVGGGSAGWMTAAYLSKALTGVKIKLVESATISTIGVGEATFSTIKLFFDYLGLDERDWMPKCNAAYKLAIKFVNWNKEGQHFYHPFQRYETVDGFYGAEWWLKLGKHKDLQPFDYSCFVTPALCDHKRSPRYFDGTVFDEKVKEQFDPRHAFQKNMLADLKIQYPYAYHFNASLLANFMRDYAVERNVEQILDDVVDVRLADDGSISQIITKEQGAISGDLFVDCTGFRGLLINKALSETFIPFSESLLCDSAIAIQIPKDIAKEDIQPYTTATALNSGWVWNIPLYGRDGTGYVYSSAFISKDEAEKEFRKHLGPASDNCKPLHIKMRIGRNRNSWVKNCVAIGLSSGFVEPLESTGIFFIQHGIEELVSHLPAKQINEEMIKSYNKAIAECIDGIRDFLTIHYFGSNRMDTPFWKATKQETVVPDELMDRLRLWKTRLPNNKNINMNYHGFESYSYSVMLMGLGHRPDDNLPILNHLSDEKALASFRAMKERADYLCSTLPSQYEYLKTMYP